MRCDAVMFGLLRIGIAMGVCVGVWMGVIVLVTVVVQDGVDGTDERL